MRRVLLFISLVLITFGLKAQVTITADDMPDPGDTLRSSFTMILQGLDYQSTGENYFWDFYKTFRFAFPEIRNDFLDNIQRHEKMT